MIDWIALIALTVQADQTVISAVEPSGANVLMTSLVANCPGHNLRVIGVGYRRPASLPRITLNGRPLRGALVQTMRNDLSSARAVYQFGVGCDQVRRGIFLTIYSTEGPANRIAYRVGSATIRNGQLVEYSPMHPTTAENFYWRN